MSKKVVWHCDNTNCNAQVQAWDMPPGWLSLVFINNGKEYRYSFCSYSCLAQWSQSRNKYYEERAK